MIRFVALVLAFEEYLSFLGIVLRLGAYAGLSSNGNDQTLVFKRKVISRLVKILHKGFELLKGDVPLSDFLFHVLPSLWFKRFVRFRIDTAFQL
jgi:hypothetical protein